MEGNAIVLPGDVLSSEKGYLRGHGTFVIESKKNTTENEENNDMYDEDEELYSDEEMEGHEENSNSKAIVSSVAGVVSRINRLIQVNPIQYRYTGEVGDVIVGRVIEVEQRRWKVDLNAQHYGTLHLGAINLPGGALRRRTVEDSLNMRTFFTERDLISAEIAKVNTDGRLNVHTRSLRYGKLENGVVVYVGSQLIKRSKNHFISFNEDIGIDAIFGLNGIIWLQVRNKLAQQERDTVEDTKMISEMEEKQKIHASKVYSKKERLQLARMRNVIVWMNKNRRFITEETVEAEFMRSIQLKLEPKDILSNKFHA